MSGEQLATLRSALKRRIETHVSYAQLADMHAGAVGFVRDGEIVQILDDETCLASVTWGDYGQHQRVVILTGFPTCTHVDGDEIGFVPIKVIGRRTYQAAAGGPRTTWVLAWIAEVYDAAP